MSCRSNDIFCSLHCTMISVPFIAYIFKIIAISYVLFKAWFKNWGTSKGKKAKTAELKSLFGTYWFTALQTHSKVFFSASTNKLHIHIHFKNHHFQHKLFLVLISKSSSKLTVSCSGVHRNFFRRGSTNSVEDRGQRERGSGGGSPLVRGSGGSCNLVQEHSIGKPTHAHF